MDAFAEFGRPYGLTTGRDDNRDSIASDRPGGVRSNTLQGPAQPHLICGGRGSFVQQDKEEGRRTVFTLGVDAFNVLNRTNYTGFVGNLSSPFFGLPVAARPTRRLQLRFGFEF